MALNPKIIHFRIITKKQLPAIPGDQQTMILCTDTGEVFWQYRRQRYKAGAVPVQADWSQTNQQSLSYVKNKPDIKKLEQRLSELQQTNQSQSFITILDNMIETRNDGSLLIRTGRKDVPIQIQTISGSFYPIQKDTLIQLEGQICLKVNRYLIYQNSNIIPTGWKVYYGR